MVDTQRLLETQAARLPANRAFVVQFQEPLGEQASAIAGRAEHLTSGHRVRFQSWEELRCFIETELAQLTAPSSPAS